MHLAARSVRNGSGNRRYLPSRGPHCVLRSREQNLGVSEPLESIPNGTVASKSQHGAMSGGNCARLLWRRPVIISPMKEFTHRYLARRLWQTRAPSRPTTIRFRIFTSSSFNFPPKSLFVCLYIKYMPSKMRERGAKKMLERSGGTFSSAPSFIHDTAVIPSCCVDSFNAWYDGESASQKAGTVASRHGFVL